MVRVVHSLAALTRTDVGGPCLTCSMQEVPPIDELDEAEILDRLDTLHTTQRSAEVQILRLAAQFAVLHDEQTLVPGTSVLPGRERAARFGGAATPLVTEFCAAELGARLQLTPGPHGS